MNNRFLKLAVVTATTLASCVGALAQSTNPNCQRLEAQLASLDRGNNDPVRADQIRHAEDAVHRQQFEVDRLVAQSRRMGCENSGFFSIFNNPPPQCGSLTRQIDQQRNALERLQNQLEQLSGGTTERAAQRQSLLIALGDNGCGPQYRSAALQGQQGGFFDRLFGGNGGVFSAPSGQMGGTFRTICVRTCDGFYFPISFETTPDRFRDDEAACQRMCPAAEVRTLHLSQPGRGRAAGGFAQRPALHRTANRVQLSQGAQSGLQLPPAGRELGRSAQSDGTRPNGGTRRCGRHGTERQAAVAAAGRRRRQADPTRSAREDTGGASLDRGSTGRNRPHQTHRSHGWTNVSAGSLTRNRQRRLLSACR